MVGRRGGLPKGLRRSSPQTRDSRVERCNFLLQAPSAIGAKWRWAVLGRDVPALAIMLRFLQLPPEICTIHEDGGPLQVGWEVA